MVAIGLKISEGLKLVDMDVVGLETLDRWFELSFGSLGFRSWIVVILCLVSKKKKILSKMDCWVVAEDGLMGLCLYSF